MAYLPSDFELPHPEMHYPTIYEVVDGQWRATQVTRLGRCVAIGDTLSAVQDALEELIRIQFTEECHDAEARELIRKIA